MKFFLKQLGLASVRARVTVFACSEVVRRGWVRACAWGRPTVAQLWRGRAAWRARDIGRRISWRLSIPPLPALLYEYFMALIRRHPLLLLWRRYLSICLVSPNHRTLKLFHRTSTQITTAIFELLGNCFLFHIVDHLMYFLYPID